MHARITQFEIDLLRIGAENAVDRFKELILPGLQQQSGYIGVYALLSPDGKGALVSLWDTEEAANAGLASGFYDEQIAKFVTFFRSPPGREQYNVVFAEGPAVVPTPR